MGLPTNVTTFVDLITWTNTNSKGFFGWFLLFAIWGIWFFLINKYETDRGGESSKAFVAASFLTAICAFLSQMIGFTSNLLFVTFILMTAAGAMYVVITHRGRT